MKLCVSCLICSSIAAVYRLQRRFDKAEPLFQHVLDSRRRLLGTEHPKTLNSMNSYGLMLRDAGKWTDALLMLTECLSLRERLLSRMHDDTLKSMHNLATTHALLLGARAHGDLEESVTPHPPVGVSTGGESLPASVTLALSQTARNTSHADAAERGLLECLRCREILLGASHPNTLDTQAELGYLYVKLGRYAEAQKLLDSAYSMRREKLGATDVSVMKVFAQLQACREMLEPRDGGGPSSLEAMFEKYVP